MHDENDRQEFLKRIRENTADDNVRLFYAEWLDDHAKNYGPCGCDGGSMDTGGAFPWGEPVTQRCIMCSGTGEMTNGFAERAAFIRAQVELGKLNCDLPEQKRTCVRQERSAWAASVQGLGDEINPWFKLIGRSKAYRADQHELSEGHPFQAIFRRGFVDEIRCSLNQWMGTGECDHCGGRGWWRNHAVGPPEQEYCDTCGGTGIHPAIGPLVVASQPVTKVTLNGLEPLELLHNGYFGWYDRQYMERQGLQEEEGEAGSWLPTEFIRLMPAEGRNTCAFPNEDYWAWYDSRDLAFAALSTAAIRWAENRADTVSGRVA
jgi:uncharacterized protein (TIGR02996 family)